MGILEQGKNLRGPSHSRRRSSKWISAYACCMALLLAIPPSSKAQEITYSSDAEFDLGTAVDVNHEVSGQLQLNTWERRHSLVWVVKTGRNSIVRLDADTGEILGEYRTAPASHAGNPSRTAVDASGNVWVGNRSEGAGGLGSVAKVGLVLGGTRVHKNSDGSLSADPQGAYLAPPFLYCTAVDRDGDGLIHTSRGLGDVLSWPDLGDGDGGLTAELQDAEDEGSLLFQRTTAAAVHHVAIAPDGRVWVGGFQSGPMGFDVLHPLTGRILESLLPGCGGYGGIVDAHGVLWSASYNQGTLLRYDTATTQTTCSNVQNAAGVAIAADGSAWCSMWDRNAIAKLTPEGDLVEGFPKQTGGRNAFGVAIGFDGDVWVANRSSNDVSRLDAMGNLKTKIPVGAAPMGICVDGNGNVWVVNQNSNDVMRIDPAAGADGLGAVEQTVALGSGASPIAYGPMSRVVSMRQVSALGTWSVVHDGGSAALAWDHVSWSALEPGSSRIDVSLRAAEATGDLAGETWIDVGNGTTLSHVQGRYLEVRVTFHADPQEPISPVLLDLHIVPQVEINSEPLCLGAMASVETLWPPDGRMVPVEIVGLRDADGDPLEVRITRILQDEPVEQGNGTLDVRDGSSIGPDASGTGTAVAQLRAERAGNGNGRVYTLDYVASDGHGGSCEGQVTVCVPHDQGQGQSCVDDGPLYDSTQWSGSLQADNFPNPFNPATTIRYTLTEPASVRLCIYDALGRRVRTLVTAEMHAGSHSVPWNGLDESGRELPSGVYLCRLTAGSQEASHRMLLLK